jgi:hypothetical protein
MRTKIVEYLAKEPVSAFEHALETMDSYAEEAGIVIDTAMQLEALQLAITKLQDYARSIQL